MPSTRMWYCSCTSFSHAFTSTPVTGNTCLMAAASPQYVPANTVPDALRPISRGRPLSSVSNVTSATSRKRTPRKSSSRTPAGRAAATRASSPPTVTAAAAAAAAAAAIVLAYARLQSVPRRRGCNFTHLRVLGRRASEGIWPPCGLSLPHTLSSGRWRCYQIISTWSGHVQERKTGTSSTVSVWQTVWVPQYDAGNGAPPGWPRTAAVLCGPCALSSARFSTSGWIYTSGKSRCPENGHCGHRRPS